MKSVFSFLIAIITISTSLFAQEEKPAHLEFWESLAAHSGKSYAGKVVSAPVPEEFQQQDLVMYFKSSGEGQIKIPLVVGQNRSRVWIFTLQEHSIQLKHDHRERDGSPNDITMYGGTSTNTGFDSLQYFPADQETVELIPYAATNVWWVTLSDSTFTYNLRRINSDSAIRLEFDLTKEVATPKAPWGWGE